MCKANTFKEMAAFTVVAGSFLGIKKLPEGLVFFALQKDKTQTPSDYTCKINGISTESYKCVYRKGRYYIRFYVLGKVFHTEVINFTEVDMPSENEKDTTKDMAEELEGTQNAMAEADEAITNATLATVIANLEAVESLRESTKVFRELTRELDSISRKANKPIKEAIGEAVRKANKPIEEAIRNFRLASRKFQEAERKAEREAERKAEREGKRKDDRKAEREGKRKDDRKAEREGKRKADRKAKRKAKDTTKALEELFNALSID